MLDCFAFDRLIFYGSMVRLQPHDLDPLILQFGGDLDPLIDSQKGFDSLIQFNLNLVANASTQDISDYFLNYAYLATSLEDM